MLQYVLSALIIYCISLAVYLYNQIKSNLTYTISDKSVRFNLLGYSWLRESTADVRITTGIPAEPKQNVADVKTFWLCADRNER